MWSFLFQGTLIFVNAAAANKQNSQIKNIKKRNTTLLVDNTTVDYRVINTKTTKYINKPVLRSHVIHADCEIIL